MTQSPPPVSTAVSKCALCKNDVLVSKIYCLNCGFPQNGSKEQKDHFKKEREQIKASLRTAKSKVTGASAVMGGVGAVILVFSLAIAGGFESVLGMVLGVGAGLTLISLCIWANFKPIPALTLGTVLYGLFLAIEIINSILTTGFPGIMGLGIKGLIFAVFIIGINGARKASELEEQLKK